jgi:hypothetical protein
MTNLEQARIQDITNGLARILLPPAAPPASSN